MQSGLAKVCRSGVGRRPVAVRARCFWLMSVYSWTVEQPVCVRELGSRPGAVGSGQLSVYVESHLGAGGVGQQPVCAEARGFLSGAGLLGFDAVCCIGSPGV